jgi:hypothetical protein
MVAHTPTIPELRRLRQEDQWFKGRLGYRIEQDPVSKNKQ